MSQSVTVVVIYNPQLPNGAYPLIPAEEYLLCFDCDADIRFTNKACDAHPVVRKAGQWLAAIIIFNDGKVQNLKNPATHTLQS